MRISQLSLEGRGAWPDLHLDDLSPQLNVFCAPPRAGKSTVARLVSRLLYGKSDSPWRQQFGQAAACAEGTIRLEGAKGQFVLRRHRNTGGGDKLTLASVDGQAVDGHTIRSLLSNVSPELAGQLFAVDFAESPPVEWLLSENFSRQYLATQRTASTDFTAHCGGWGLPDAGQTAEPIDRRRVEELVRRRNTIAHEIEQLLSVQRREDGVLEQELAAVDKALSNKRQRTKQLREKRRNVETQLAEIEARLRYISLEIAVGRDAAKPNPQQHAQELNELDAEITRCRQTLSELQTRGVVVRTELAQLSPDSDAVTYLADGRTTLTVMERLLDDLDAEVAQLARANEPGRGLGADAHAKLSPVAEMLRQQIYTLCGQLSEQERLARHQRALDESRQLSRTQINLGERLELLRSRRAALVQESRVINQPVALSPLPPVAEHCRCDHHHRFAHEFKTAGLGSANRQQIEHDAQCSRGALERERAELVDALTALQLDIDRLELRWKELQRQRGGLLNGASLEDRRAELARLEGIINQSLQPARGINSTPRQEIWRASDVLAQLTDGELVQIQLERPGNHARIIDRKGRSLTVESLSPTQHDALYLALTLALVASYARRSVDLPLILDEPFLRQDGAGAAIMAGVLQEFSRAGHQLLVFTEDRDAQRQFKSRGVAIVDLETLRRQPIAASSLQAAPDSEKVSHASTNTSTRVVRETIDGRQTPGLRLAPINGDTNNDDVFYLAETSSLAEFPVLGSETSAVFSRLDIQTIGDLLAADATDVARQLQRSEIRPETVELWQKHMGLMCFVPEVSLNDACLLSASGIASPGDLVDASADHLLQAIETTCADDSGRRFTSALRDRVDRARLAAWIHGAGRTRQRWNQARSQYLWAHAGSPSRKRHSISHSKHQTRKQKFFLQCDSEVETAPSIGPKTAARLNQVGIRTVADLLNADVESTAEELDVSHITSEKIAAWQHQARLVCRIPQLHGYGAQLLVACGFTEPEQISSAGLDDVATKISKICQTKKGQRILRNGDAPDRQAIEEWIESAGHMRPLEAA